MSYQQEKFKEIADKLRERLNTTELIVPNDFVLKIDEVAEYNHQKGYEAGLEAGGGKVLLDADTMRFPLANGSIGKVSTDSKHYDDIAYNLGIYGKSDIYPSDMADEVVRIANEREAYGEAQGRQAQKSEFWERFLKAVRAGSNLDMMFAGRGWNDETFYPYTPTGTSDNPEVIKPPVVTQMFYYCARGTGAFNLADRLRECNWRLDTSECTNLSRVFDGAYLTGIPLISAVSTTSNISMDRTFNGCSYLVTIEGLALKEDGKNTFSNTFTNCTALENINVITGIIGNDISFANSPNLKSDTVDRIVGALKNLADSERPKALSLNANVNVTPEQTAIATQKGWSIAQ